MAYDPAKDYTSKGGSRAREANPARQGWPLVLGPQAKYPRCLWINADGEVTGIPVDNPQDVSITIKVAAGYPVPVSFRTISAAPAGTVCFR